MSRSNDKDESVVDDSKFPGVTHHSRDFLNTDEGLAALETKVDPRGSFFQVGDCQRSIKIHLGNDTETSRRVGLEKLDLVIHRLRALRSAMSVAEVRGD